MDIQRNMPYGHTKKYTYFIAFYKLSKYIIKLDKKELR